MSSFRQVGHWREPASLSQSAPLHLRFAAASAAMVRLSYCRWRPNLEMKLKSKAQGSVVRGSLYGGANKSKGNFVSRVEGRAPWV
jgi:hypothetical protein